MGGVLTVTIIVAAVAPQLLFTVYDIVAVPAAIPVTTPFVLPIAAMPVDPELHIPPVTPSLNGIVAPIHAKGVPVIVPAFGTITAIVVVAVLPQPTGVVTVSEEVKVPAAVYVCTGLATVLVLPSPKLQE